MTRRRTVIRRGQADELVRIHPDRWVVYCYSAQFLGINNDTKER